MIRGIMLDVSRGASFNINYLKQQIILIKKYNFTHLMLYLEDIFIIESYPGFGYKRGAYSTAELKELRQFAIANEIVLVPGIQTLGHLENFLKWPDFEYMKENSSVLKTNGEALVFINNMLDVVKDIFSTDNIHLGFDECEGLGLGSSYIDGICQEQIFLDHLNDVYNYAHAIGFKHIGIYSDFLYSLSYKHKPGEVYNIKTVISKKIIEFLPKNITLYLWNYWEQDASNYDIYIKQHQALDRKVILCTGLGTWQNITLNDNCFKSTYAAIDTALRHKTDIYFTAWNDDMAYCDFDTLEYGLALISKHYGEDINYSDFAKDKKIVQINNLGYNPSALLFDDFIYNIYLSNDVDSNSLDILVNNTLNYLNSMKGLNNYYITLGSYLLFKLDTYQKLINKNYDIDYEQGMDLLSKLNDIYRKRWLDKYKYYGIENIQNMLSMQMIRLEELCYIINHKPELLDNLDTKIFNNVKHNYRDLSLVMNSRF